MSIKSKDGSTSSYTITYSSGEPETFLKDGVVFSYQLEKDRKATFYYNNPHPQTYLTISSANSSSLAKISISFFYSDDGETKQELAVQKPAVKRKTQNASITYILPEKDQISVEVVAKENTSITLILNDH